MNVCVFNTSLSSLNILTEGEWVRRQGNGNSFPIYESALESNVYKRSFSVTV